MRFLIIGQMVIIFSMLTACSRGEEAGPDEPAGPQDPISVSEIKWEISVESVETESQLDMKLDVGTSVETHFYLSDPSATFLLVSMSLKPTTEDKILDLTEMTVCHNKGNCFAPIGMKETAMSEWKIRTSGTCTFEILSDNELKSDCDFAYDSENEYGIMNDDLKGQESSWSGTATIFQGPMFILAYAVPSEALSSGELRLEIPGSEPVEL